MRKNKTALNVASFKWISNTCKCTIKAAKCAYDDSIGNCLISENNQWKFWNYIKSKSSKNCSKYHDLIINDNHGVAIDSLALCNILNNFFAQSFVMNDDSTQNYSQPDSITACSSTKEDHHVPNSISIKEIANAIQKINGNSAPGIDGIPNSLIKNCANILLPYLHYLFNCIIATKVFPALWKRAIIVPIPKKNNNNSIENFHPISLLPSFSKLFEYILNSWLCHFLEDNNLICNSQFGFRKHNSTTGNLLHFTNFVHSAITSKKDVHSVMIDFKKAFDSINHYVLINKLHNYNLSQDYIYIIKSYLNGRTQQTYCNNHLSTSVSITSGVPQGSLLAPTLFNIFINNVVDNLTCNCSMYADDIKLFTIIRPTHLLDDIADFQSNISRVQKWSIDNKLPININKTYYMIFTKQKNKGFTDDNLVDYYLGEEKIMRINSFNDLGVTYDSNMCFTEHYHTIASKAMRATFAMNKVFNFSSQQVKLQLYKSFIQPILIYASEVWNPSKAGDINIIEKVQHLATKHFILHNYYDSYNCRLEICGLPQLRIARKIKDMVYLYKLFHHLGGNLNLTSFNIKLSKSKHHKFDLLEKFSSTSWQRQEFSFRCIADWNNLPKEVKQASNSKTFKAALHKLNRFI